MRKKKLLFVSALLILTACSKKEEPEIDKGTVIIDNDNNLSNQKAPVPILDPVYQDEENLSLFIPNESRFTDDKGVVYIRKNMPQLGISALIPEKFEMVDDDNGYLTFKNNIFSVSFTSIANKNNNPNMLHVFMEDKVRNDFRHYHKEDTFTVAEFELGEQKIEYSDTDVFVRDDGQVYIQAKKAESLSSSEKVKMISNIKQEFAFLRMNSLGVDKETAPYSIANTKPIMDYSSLMISNYYGEDIKEANRINDIIAKSVMYIQNDKTFIDIGQSFNEYNFLGKTIKVPSGFKSTSSGINYSTFELLVNSNDTAISGLTLTIAAEKVSKDNLDVLDVFGMFDNIKASLSNKYAKDLKLYTPGDDVILSTYEKRRNVKSSFYETSGEYILIGNKKSNKQDKYIKNFRERGLYRSMYLDKDGILLTVFIESPTQSFDNYLSNILNSVISFSHK